MNERPSFWARMRNALLAGLFVLLPLFVIVWVLQKIRLALRGPVEQVAQATGVDRLLGVATITILSVVAVLLLCLLAGLFLQATALGRLSGWLEENVLRFIPGYGQIRLTLRSTLGTGGKGTGPQAVLFDAGNGHQPAVLQQRLGDGRCLLFMPGVPDPQSGGIMLAKEGDVLLLDCSVADLNACLRNYGEGLAALRVRGPLT